MSTQNATGARRPYRKRRRAQLEAETRLRITDAAVELHGSVGPARTTISAVADRAGVQRATVYRHFPDEEALFDACSSHWMAQHPLPDPARWTQIEDPARLRVALAELYEWYEHGEYMLERTTRDLALVPALRPSMEAFHGWLDAAANAILHGRPKRGRPSQRLRAAVGHALAFETWRSLAIHQGLPRAETIELMEALANAADQD
jgi:AcrR family transcriptional regulator